MIDLILNETYDWFVLTKKVRLTTTSIVLVQTEPQTTDVHPRCRSSSPRPQHRRRQTVPTTPHRPPSVEPRPSRCGIGTALIIPSSIIVSGHVVQTGNGSREVNGWTWLAKACESQAFLCTQMYTYANLFNRPINKSSYCHWECW